MIEQIIVAGLASAFWVWLVVISPALPEPLQKYRAHKPFSCQFCMSFWVAVIMMFMLKIPLVSEFVYVSAGAFISLFLYSVLDRTNTLILR